MNPMLEKELHEQLKRLAPEQQHQVLDFARALALSGIHGVSEATLSFPVLLRPYGLCAGEFTVPDDFDAPLPESIIMEFEGK